MQRIAAYDARGAFSTNWELVMKLVLLVLVKLNSCVNLYQFIGFGWLLPVIPRFGWHQITHGWIHNRRYIVKAQNINALRSMFTIQN